MTCFPSCKAQGGVISVLMFLCAMVVVFESNFFEAGKQGGLSSVSGSSDANKGALPSLRPANFAEAAPVEHERKVDTESQALISVDDAQSEELNDEDKSTTRVELAPAADTSTNGAVSKKGAESIPEDSETSVEAFEDSSGALDISTQRSRAKSFLIVFMGHSGSTAIATELREHGDFEIEELEPLDHGEFQHDTDKALKKGRVMFEKAIANGKIPGFKLRPTHIRRNPEAWQAFTKEFDTRIVWQFREHVLKQAVGEYRKDFLNDSSATEGLRVSQVPCEAGSGQLCRFKVENMVGLHKLMNEFTSNDELLSEAVRFLERDEDTTQLMYEEYLYRREETMRGLYDFLGVEHHNTTPMRLKASPDNLCSLVSNYQELCDHFYHCQLWRPFLNDAINDCRCKPPNRLRFNRDLCVRTAWFQNTK